MDSEFVFRLTQRAQADVDDIVAYLAVELANPGAAAKFLEKLQDAIDEACRFPASGWLVVNEYLPQTGVRKKKIGNYVMYYLPREQEKLICVLRVVYGRRNADEILRKLER